MAKHDLKLLLSPPIEKPRITDELAGCFDDTAVDGARTPIARVVSPFGKVWRVEVRRDGGAFLGRGWPEFLAAHGIAVGWFVVLRHEGGGVLTIKVFDASSCIKEFHPPSAAVSSITENKNTKGASYKPQFIRVMHKDFMEKMMIPARFVKQYVTGEYLNSQRAVILSPLGKFWRVKIEEDQSGMFFSGDWSHFIEFHGVSEGDVFLIKYEGNMVFKFKAFGLNGSKKDIKNQGTRIQPVIIGTQQEGNSGPLSKKRKSSDGKPCYEGNKRSSVKEPDHQTGPIAWIRKEITSGALKHGLCLPVKFCSDIGFKKSCTIQLKTEMDSTRSWKVHGLAYTHTCYLGEGWKIFCKDNRLKEGDFCNFNIVKTMLWHVTITRHNQEQQNPSSPNFGIKCESENSSINEGLKGPDGSRTSIKKASYRKSIYEIGSPSWIQKDLRTCSLGKYLYLARRFFVAIGLKVPCTITLKTSIHGAQSWKVDIKEKNSSYQLGDDWWRFCQDNGLKAGDICRFNVVKTKLWEVIITRG